jgi:hypothetical protein
VSFNVVSVPLVVLAVSLIAVSSTLGTYAVRRNRQKAALLRDALTTHPITEEHAGLSEEFSRSNLIVAFEAQTSTPSKIKTAYGLAQLMITKSLGIQPRASETPSEFLMRIDEAEPSLKDSLGRLVEVFELAEYSPYPLEADDALEAREALLKLREELENVKTREDYKR